MTSTARRQRIAFFVPDFSGGGAERVMLTVAGALGHDPALDVDLVVGADRGGLRDEVPSTVRLVVFGKERMRGCVVPLARYLREHRPDAVVPTINHANMAV